MEKILICFSFSDLKAKTLQFLLHADRYAAHYKTSFQRLHIFNICDCLSSLTEARELHLSILRNQVKNRWASGKNKCKLRNKKCLSDTQDLKKGSTLPPQNMFLKIRTQEQEIHWHQLLEKQS